ncbi:hypothetical protein BDW74DRAFT_180770 [Aspergillus multicolor]|uniref:putative DNA mismatch repair protein n=1 Tax=Aspergillus multicolor TaxID=41759 RepID=UPI003CCD34D4
MPIVALPPTTVRAIGSSSIISDPYSLAKELLDNALDASATSIFIEISQDTVDLIQVKDNGYGIPTADHGLVCRRTFTSKIHTVEDLRNVGGKSLGFRGEALASAAEISGTLTVSTRVDKDPVGSSLKYGRNGELVSTEHVSHPVGTTVRVSNLFRQIPVRRQTVVKNAKKTLLRIKKMVQAYALARPSVRLSFKVLKAKNESGNWIYAPGKNATLMEAALKVAGTEVASNSELKEWPVSDQVDALRDDPSYRLFALLPRLGSDFTKFNNLGQYISIDGRPLSSGRGVAQDIVKLYKSYLRATASRDGLSPPITDPFLCLHILCPEGTYDVNVEPAKDDILFEDQQAVLSLVEGLLRDSYGIQPDAQADHESTAQPRESPRPNGFEALLSARPQVSTRPIPTPAASHQDRGFVSARSISRAEPRFSPPEPQNRSRQPNRSSFSRFNNSRISNALSGVDAQGQRRPVQYRETHSPTADSSLREARRASNSSAILPTPASSEDSPSSRGPSQFSPTTPVRDMRQEQRERDKERYGSGSLDTWFLKLSQASQISVPTDQGEEPSLSQLTQSRFGPSSRSPNHSLAPNTGPLQPQSITRSTSPMLDLDSTPPPPRDLAQSSKFVNKPGLPVLKQWSARLYNASNPNENSELQKALEFETRKKAAIQERRKQLQNSGASVPASTNSPHQSRYLAAKAALSSQSDSVPRVSIVGKAMTSGSTAKPVLSPHDPRAYLMRIRNDGLGSSKLKRIASAKLPFEKIPDGYDLHSVSLTCPFDLHSLRASYETISKNDLYTRSGEELEGFASPYLNADIKIWHARLSGLLRTQNKPTDGPDISNVQFDFSAISQISSSPG